MSKPEYLQVNVRPKSRIDEIGETLEDGTLKVKLKTAPENGKANEALCKLLAKHFGLKANQVRIVSGHRSSRKLIRIDPSV